MIEHKEVTSQELIRQQVHSYALPTIAVCVLIGVLYWARVVFITTIIAIILALILEPFVGFLIRLRFPRTLATLTVIMVATLVLYFAGLAAWNQLSGLAAEVPAFKENLAGFIAAASDRVKALEDSTTRLLVLTRKPEPPPPVTPAPTRATKRSKKEAPPPALPTGPGPIPEVRIHEDRDPIADYIYPRLGTVYEFLLMASFVPFLVYFMLSWGDHMHRSFLRFFDGSDRLAAARSLQGVAGMARAFVVGNFLIGVLLSTVGWGAFALIHIPYPFLVGAMSGFLSLIPYAGLPLALIPPVLVAVAGADRGPVILFAFLTVGILHLTAMNVLYPKIVRAFISIL